MIGLRTWVCVIVSVTAAGSGCGEPITGPENPLDGAVDPTASEPTCLDGELRREANPPLAGSIRISEWMANPDGRDTDLEWVELWVSDAADLRGLQLGPAVDALEPVVDGDLCFPVDAGSWVVFGASPAAAPRVDAELPFSLGNAGPRSILAALDGVVLDRVDYEGANEGVVGKVDPDGKRCDGGEATPGGANPPCPVVLEAGECLEEGTARAVKPPAVGEAWISEWMADPASVDNRSGEWVEVRLHTASDLNGLTLSDRSGSSTVVESDACLSVDAGAHILFAREVDASKNGGLEGAPIPLGISLNNRDETIHLEAYGEELDRVTYESAERGVATQVDDLGSRCPAVDTYGAGDLGTPGAANPPCL